MNISLTVVVPTLNAENTVVATLASLMPLRKRGAKVVLADSYSSDKTAELAGPFVDKILQIEKGNLYAAVNLGIEQADTDWVAYLNADDLVYVDVVLAWLKNTEADLVYGNLDYIDEHGRFLQGYKMAPPKNILPLAASNISAISPIGSFYRKSLWQELNGFDTTYRYAADFDFFLRAALSGCKISKPDSKIVGAFRLRPGQLSGEEGDPCQVEGLQIVKSHNLDICLKERLSARVRFKLENIYGYVTRVYRRNAFGLRSL